MGIHQFFSLTWQFVKSLNVIPFFFKKKQETNRKLRTYSKKNLD